MHDRPGPELRRRDGRAAWAAAPEAVIPILQAIQAHYRYLPQEALERVCAADRDHAGGDRRASRRSTPSSATGRSAGT